MWKVSFSARLPVVVGAVLVDVDVHRMATRFDRLKEAEFKGTMLPFLLLQ